jgi:hypothetical protein
MSLFDHSNVWAFIQYWIYTTKHKPINCASSAFGPNCNEDGVMICYFSFCFKYFSAFLTDSRDTFVEKKEAHQMLYRLWKDEYIESKARSTWFFVYCFPLHSHSHHLYRISFALEKRKRKNIILYKIAKESLIFMY